MFLKSISINSWQLSIFIIFISFGSLFAQNKLTKDLYIQASLHRGFNVPEYSMFTYITNDYVNSVNLSIIKKTSGKNEWETLYNYPEFGVSLFYSTLGNDAIFGREFSISPFFKTNFIHKKNFNFYNQIGVGLGYVDKKYDPETNFLNVAIGSNLNIHFNFRLGVDYQIASRISLSSGLSFDHLSNANMSEPNLGINYLTAYAGFSYRIGEKSVIQSPVFEANQPKNTISLVYNVGGKYSRALSSQKYFTSSFSTEIRRNISRAFHLGLGLDVFYDASVKDRLIAAEKTYHSIDQFMTGIHFSQTLVYNKLSLTIQEGIYLFLTDKVEENFMYNRGIISYRISKKISLRLAMKSHLHILDYPEFGIAYRLL